jgi:tRNA-splicing ligase RtcB
MLKGGARWAVECTEFLTSMAIAAHSLGVEIPDRELACAPVDSELGIHYLGAMRAGINCALANRQRSSQRCNAGPRPRSS